MAAVVIFRLGSISFGVLDGVSSWHESGEAALVEQEVLAGAPKIQWLGSKLSEHEITIQLDTKITTPPAQAIEDLKDARDTGAALPLYRADGVYLGRYAVSKLGIKYQRFSPQDGTVLKAEVTLSLKEWVESEPLRFAARPQKKGRAIAKAKDHESKTEKKPGVIVNSDGYAQPTQGRKS